MKKIKFISIFLSSVMLFAACSGEKKQKVEEIKFVDSVLFYDEGSLWSENAKGEMDWYTTLNVGTVLKTYPAVEGSTSDVTESKMAVRSGKTEQIDYTRVQFNEKDYWVQSALIIPGAQPRLVVTSDTVVYAKPDLSTATETIIPDGQIIAYIGEEKDVSFDINYAKITYRAGGKAYRNVYVKTENLSTYADDVMAQKIIAKIKTSKNDVVKKELFENLKGLITSNYFEEEIQKIRFELYPEEETLDSDFEFDSDSEFDEMDENEEMDDEEEEDNSEEDDEDSSEQSLASDYDDYFEFD